MVIFGLLRQVGTLKPLRFDASPLPSPLLFFWIHYGSLVTSMPPHGPVKLALASHRRFRDTPLRRVNIYPTHRFFKKRRDLWDL